MVWVSEEVQSRENVTELVAPAQAFAHVNVPADTVSLSAYKVTRSHVSVSALFTHVI